MFTACCYDCSWVGTKYTDVSTAASEMNTHLAISTDCTSVTMLDMGEDA